MLAISEIIDGGVGVISAGHGILRKHPSRRAHTLHGEHRAHGSAFGFANQADMFLQELHGTYSNTMECIRNIFFYTCNMDIYDFDGTLYRGDSTADFLIWCLKRYPRIALTLPRTAAAACACLGLHVIDKTQYKQTLYRFLPKVPDIEREVTLFWKSHQSNITGPCHPLPGDVVISGSPEFLLGGVCAQRGLELIASQVDPHTGRVLGPNCSDGEKATRFKERYPDGAIERFYSNSLSDEPLARLAQAAFLVKDGKLLPWPDALGGSH